MFTILPATALSELIVPLFITSPTKLTLLDATLPPEVIVVFEREPVPSPVI